MFVFNYNKTELVNTAQIVKICITEPQFEQTQYCVVAWLAHGHGSTILEQGTEKECKEWMARFAG